MTQKEIQEIYDAIGNEEMNFSDVPDDCWTDIDFCVALIASGWSDALGSNVEDFIQPYLYGFEDFWFDLADELDEDDRENHEDILYKVPQELWEDAEFTKTLLEKAPEWRGCYESIMSDLGMTPLNLKDAKPEAAAPKAAPPAVAGKSGDFVIEDGVLVKNPNASGEVHIPDGVTVIGESALCWSDDLISIHIPDSVTEIRRTAFSSCDSLTSVYIPDSVKVIGQGAFDGCSSLAEISIPAGAKIAADAFNGCPGTPVIRGTSKTAKPAPEPAKQSAPAVPKPAPPPASASGKKRFCTTCGKELQPEQKFCTGCGTRAG